MLQYICKLHMPVIYSEEPHQTRGEIFVGTSRPLGRVRR
nr:MAG TPA: hypothetical protein [Caudoviricetes sp.]